MSGLRAKHRTCLRGYFLAASRMTPIGKERDGSFGPHILTIDERINAVRRHTGAPFYEKQVKVASETYGHLAPLWSTYDIGSVPDGKADARRINRTQAAIDAKRWRLRAILGESNATAGPILEKYLP
jgi:hypothetical protein